MFEVTGWQRPIISNLRGGCGKGSEIIIHKMTIYSICIRIYSIFFRELIPNMP